MGASREGNETEVGLRHSWRVGAGRAALGMGLVHLAHAPDLLRERQLFVVARAASGTPSAVPPRYPDRAR
jgi:hypothetical protein